MRSCGGTVAGHRSSVFPSNLPEAIAATTALSRAGRDPKRIVRFGVLVALGFGTTSLLGEAVLDGASSRTLAFAISSLQ